MTQLKTAFFTFIQYHFFKKYAKYVFENRHHAVECQQLVFENLMRKATQTAFGKEHQFDKIKTYEDFKKQVPIRHFEDFKPYIERIFDGEKDVLWVGQPSFFAKSSGTTDAPKYLPVTDDFIKSTQFAAKYMLCNLILTLHHARFIGDKVFYLTDQQDFEMVQGFKCEAISEIKASLMPRFVSFFSIPKRDIIRITDPAEKLNAIVNTLQGNDIRMAVALPVWLSHFLKQFQTQTGHLFKDLFPNFKVLFVSGMNYEPYRSLLQQHLGENVMILENYTATEGNIAYQPVPNVKGMELICNQGLFYEFIPLSEMDIPKPTRLSLNDIALHTSYALVLSGNQGLWAYQLNDIVTFLSINPYRLIVNGRLKDIFSPFGEHMLPIQAEQAVATTCAETQTLLTDFIIVPDFNFATYRYRCYVESDCLGVDSAVFAETLHKNLCLNNSYYDDLVKTKAVSVPSVICVRKNFFYDLLQQKHSRLKAQQKMVHVSQDFDLISLIETLNA